MARRLRKRNDQADLPLGLPPGLEEWPHFVSIGLRWPTLLDELRRAFPCVDVKAELAKCHAWLTANPRRAAHRDMSRTLYNWMSGARQETATQEEAAAKAAAVEARRRDLREVIGLVRKLYSTHGTILLNGLHALEIPSRRGFWRFLEGEEHLRAETATGAFPWDRISSKVLSQMVSDLRGLVPPKEA